MFGVLYYRVQEIAVYAPISKKINLFSNLQQIILLSKFCLFVWPERIVKSQYLLF